MRLILSILAIACASSAAVAEQAQDRESAFVACLAEKEPAMIAKIRDADSKEGFMAAFKQGLTICPAEIEGMSLARLFRALSAYKQGSDDA